MEKILSIDKEKITGYLGEKNYFRRDIAAHAASPIAAMMTITGTGDFVVVGNGVGIVVRMGSVVSALPSG